MPGRGVNAARREYAGAIAVAVSIDAAWVLLTAATGKTYHLAPLLAATAPGFVMRARPRPRLPALAIGVIGVAVGWLLIVLSGIAPTATIVDGQPGGVAGEVVAFAALGLAIGAGRGPTWLVGRLRRGRRASGTDGASC